MGRKKLFYEPLKANQKGRRDVEGRRSTLVTAKESPEPMERPRSSSTQNARGTTLSRGIQERSTGPSSTVASTARAWSKRRPRRGRGEPRSSREPSPEPLSPTLWPRETKSPKSERRRENKRCARPRRRSRLRRPRRRRRWSRRGPLRRPSPRQLRPPLPRHPKSRPPVESVNAKTDVFMIEMDFFEDALVV